MTHILRYLRGLLRRLFTEPREPSVISENHGRSETIQVSLWQTRQLTAYANGVPERVAAQYISQALDDAGLDHEITYGDRPLFDPPEESNDSRVLKWWRENGPAPAKHSNLLLYDALGGGRAYRGGKYGIVGANRITSPVPVKRVCNNDVCDNVWAVIHELGHNLGGRHSTPMMKKYPQMMFSNEMEELLQEQYG